MPRPRSKKRQTVYLAGCVAKFKNRIPRSLSFMVIAEDSTEAKQGAILQAKDLAAQLSPDPVDISDIVTVTAIGEFQR